MWRLLLCYVFRCLQVCVACFLDNKISEGQCADTPVYLVGHSFGSLVAYKWLTHVQNPFILEMKHRAPVPVTPTAMLGFILAIREAALAAGLISN